jgi:ADP-dependent NAD(P)H-hydrate dehydratase / NAD(P)H-hydrate epimerase
MKALTAAEMREVDRLTTERYGIPSLQLMESAGLHVAEAVELGALADRTRRIAVLCGKGNNGGDGLVAAQILKKARYEPQVFLFGRREEMKGDAAANLDRWLGMPGEIVEITDERMLEESWERVSKAHVIVDALLGTGLRGPITGTIAAIVTKLNDLSRNATLPKPAVLLAVDMPTGLLSDGERAEGPVLRVHKTVTFTAPKIGQLISQDAPSCGELKVGAIGTPASLVEEIGRGAVRWAGPGEFAALPLVRAADSHKGTFGHALLLAGSTGKSGAAVLAGIAALRTGAGLVTIATPEAVQPIVAAGAPEYMTTGLSATKAGTLSLRNLTDGTFFDLEDGKSVLGIGPGLGTHKQTQEFVRTVVAQTELPVILDADGLNAFAEDGESLSKRKTKFLAITPHPGEMARLMGVSTKEVQADRVSAARESAERWNAHVILKGFHTIIAAPNGELFVNTTGNPALAKGGTGDVLTGVLAALTSQFGTADWLRVLALSAYLHGAAAAALGLPPDRSGVLAHEIARGIPNARAVLLKELQIG